MQTGKFIILQVEIDYSPKSQRVIWVLSHLCKRRSKPKQIRMDNGPEFIAVITQEWSKANDINFLYIQLGKPTQNAYVERFNGSFRRGVLNAFTFETMDQVREQTEIWINDYNNFRPHESLGNIPPVMYAQKVLI